MHPDIFLTIDKNSSSTTILFQQNSVFHFSQQQKILLRYMIVWNMVYELRVFDTNSNYFLILIALQHDLVNH